MIGAVIAMKNEAEILARHMKITERETRGGAEISVGSFAGEKVALAVSGIGKVNAAAATAVLLENYPVEKLVNFGLAGGVNPDMDVFDIAPVGKCLQYDFDLREINGTPLGTLNERAEPWFALATPAFPAKKRSVGTADRFSGDPAEARFLGALGVDLRDMEGAAIAQIADKYGVPLYMWKAVSDVAGKNAPEEYAANSARALALLGEKLPALFGFLK